MARERMVTRTVVVTEVEVICLDVVNVETTIQTLELTGAKYTHETALKSLKKEYETDTFKVVAIQSMTEHEEMYGMSELKFIREAIKLDPQTRKVIEAMKENGSTEE